MGSYTPETEVSYVLQINTVGSVFGDETYSMESSRNWQTVLRLITLEGHYQIPSIMEWVRCVQQEEHWTLRVVKTTTITTHQYLTQEDFLDGLQPSCVTDTEALEEHFGKE